ncbi:HDOD domain-containing protein [Oceanicoccus sp. KOV_DT_Chl]|uniref:HDOD domain-containing protein n=1 Tax=Oceanicoccus sp. KOV_DT_Chl TaxID=1904639 RepID=UPI000C7B9382|nr:HDOD domain-containing protein [Oceanicoccus sp. KOV_DT_Chl]
MSDPELKPTTKTTQQWVKQLSHVQLPVLSGVMQELNAVTQSSDSSASQLSEIILKDSALTTKVLRIANSVYHNPNSDNAVTTISRAVVQLGFQGIKAISLSVMMVDSLLKQNTKERMLEWMARGFHTAVQAENLLQQAGGNEKEEEVFITSLLLHVGEMAFWSTKGDAVEQLDSKLDAGSCGDPQLEQQLLGSSMREITRALAEEWQLGSRLQEALDPGMHPSKATEAVLLGEEISLATEKGWDSQEFRDVLVKASLFSGLGLEAVREMIEQGADKAAGVALAYGANKICHLIPSTTEKVAPPEIKSMKSNPQLQLDILREMGAMVEQMVDVNTLFQMVVEGIHRGIGLERVCICLVDPKVTQMQAKYVLGDNTDEWRSDLNFPIKSDQDNIFAHCLHSRTNAWLRKNTTHQFNHLINKKTERLIDTNNCLISAVYAGSRPIGVIVADRGLKKPVQIDQEQHESFDHFSQQTSMSLAMLAEKARQRRRG